MPKQWLDNPSYIWNKTQKWRDPGTGTGPFSGRCALWWRKDCWMMLMDGQWTKILAPSIQKTIHGSQVKLTSCCSSRSHVGQQKYWNHLKTGLVLYVFFIIFQAINEYWKCVMLTRYGKKRKAASWIMNICCNIGSPATWSWTHITCNHHVTVYIYIQRDIGTYGCNMAYIITASSC